MGNCKDCKFWKKYHSLRPVKDELVVGNCMRMQEGSLDDSDAFTTLSNSVFTKPNFGCTLFEQRSTSKIRDSRGSE